MFTISEDSYLHGFSTERFFLFMLINWIIGFFYVKAECNGARTCFAAIPMPLITKTKC
jgi:hypothetical protein